VSKKVGLEIHVSVQHFLCIAGSRMRPSDSDINVLWGLLDSPSLNVTYDTNFTLDTES
jgi:hypothetical protein